LLGWATVKTKLLWKHFRIGAFGARIAAGILCADIGGFELVSNAASVCDTDSQTNSLGQWVYINSAPCGTFGEIVSRWETINGVPIPVTLKYMVHDPAGPANAIGSARAGGTVQPCGRAREFVRTRTWTVLGAASADTGG
jgi:hypothetical protein